MDTAKLSPRLQQCVDLAAAGKSNKEIAAEMHICVGTVKLHISRAFLALGVRSRWQLMARRITELAPKPEAVPSVARGWRDTERPA